MFFDKKISDTMRERKKRAFTLDVKAVDSTGTFAGYASVFGVVDNQKDIIMPGAFIHTLHKRVKAIKLLWQHQQDEPVGVFDTMYEDKKGLYVQGRLLLDIQRGREAYTLLQEGALNGLSIGYSPIRYTTDTQTGITRLYEVALWEISLVTFLANESAQITMVKFDSPAVLESAERIAPECQLLALSEMIDRAISTIRY